jgi:predicted cupin superfamily sugar epimerase
MDPRAQRLIERLGLAPHPEGGFFREHFRAAGRVVPEDARGARAALTAIHFLLPAGQVSRWHVVASDELWSFHEGDPLELVCVEPETLHSEQIRLGRASDGDTPAFAVPAGHWQAAWPTGAFALVSCAVGPGFDFADFRLLGDDPAARRRLEAGLARFVHLL